MQSKKNGNLQYLIPYSKSLYLYTDKVYRNMNKLSKYLVDQILLEDKSPIKKVIVVYGGRFQHNLFYDNGLKLFGPDGLKLSDKIQKKIEKLIDSKITRQLSKPKILGRVKRIEDVSLLRSIQFPEDAGSNSHPIRPNSYKEINNLVKDFIIK